MVTVADKVYNIDLVVNDIKEQPQTYGTILKEEILNPTFQFNLRRKINKLCKEGIIFKTTIPGTRFGQVILYSNPKTYKILVEATRTGISVYYFFNYKKISNYYLRLDKYWELAYNKWLEKNNEKILFEGKILKFF
jgi:hypothetical protein